MQDITTVCAWCNKVIRPGEDGDASHGICKPCAQALLDDMKRERPAGD